MVYHFYLPFFIAGNKGIRETINVYMYNDQIIDVNSNNMVKSNTLI